VNRRRLATRVASRLGLVPALERFASRPALAVLVYHRILEPDGHPYDKGVIEATPEQFDDQMRMLKRRHAVVDPEELLELVARPSKITRFRVAITFDDGYRDNYRCAFPILKSHGLRALFFLPTHYVGTRRLTWWDQIAHAVRATDRDELALEYPKPVRVAVDRRDREPAIRAVIRAYSRPEASGSGGAGVRDVERFLEGVRRAGGVAWRDESDDPQFMTWEEAAEMQRAGMALGSHTHSHRILGVLSAEEQEEECRGSRERLREQGISADSLAYPVGGRTSFSPATVRCAKDVGYRCAFSNYGGINVPESMDPFDVKRVGMSLEEPMAQLRLRLALSSAARRQAW
jgi:peptidoglycan/xylan/chitin deacetylase (PgdA/CDA1 family)